MTLLLLLILVVPLFLAVTTILVHAGDMIAWLKSLSPASIPPPPEWVGKIPLAGVYIAKKWTHFSTIGMHELSQLAVPYMGKGVRWFVEQAGNMTMVVIRFLLTVIIAAVLYVHGEAAAASVRRFARRLAGTQGEEAAVLSARAIRGVALGVLVTAVIQSGLGGIGLIISGIPAAVLLTAVMLILCIAQLGPGLVLLPAVIWLFWSGETLWGVFLLIWGIFVGVSDNFIRPVLIRKGADLPLLLILAGVIGGLIAFGIIGLFIGPVLLAVAYTLLSAWVRGDTTQFEGCPSAGEDPEAGEAGR